jgi:hypothetical protein
MRAMSVFPRLRRALVLRPMIMYMRMRVWMTVDHVTMAVLMIVGMSMWMLMC